MPKPTASHTNIVLFYYRGPTDSATSARRHASVITPSSECPRPDRTNEAWMSLNTVWLFAGVKMGRIPKVEKERALQLHQATSTSSSSSSSSSPLSSSSASAHPVYHATVTTSSQSHPYHMNGRTPSLTAVNGERAHQYVMNRLSSASAESSRNGCLHETDDNFQHTHGSDWVSANCFETWELCMVRG